MKKLILFCLFLQLTFLAGYAQKVTYAYDASGNRVSRQLVISQKAPSQNSNEYYQEELGRTEIKLYPNPVKTNLTVDIVGYDSKMVGELVLYDMNGKMLTRAKIDSSRVILDLTGYSTGTYIMRIMLNGEQSTWKIIKE